jgi:hypothetical protein
VISADPREATAEELFGDVFSTGRYQDVMSYLDHSVSEVQ